MFGTTSVTPQAGEMAAIVSTASEQTGAQNEKMDKAVDAVQNVNSVQNDSAALENPVDYSMGTLDAEFFLHENYRLRRNVLRNKVEILKLKDAEPKFQPMSDQVLNGIILNSHREGFVGKYDISGDIKMLVDSDEVPLYDPVNDWLDSLTWDGKDRLVDFWRRIPGVDVNMLHFLCMWHRSTVAHWMGVDEEHGNECVPTLIGAQGCGKSTFCVRLLPKHLRDYYMDNFNLANKNDKNMALSDSLLVCLDEMDQYKPGQQAELKQALSKVTVNGRKIYGRTHEIRPRRASFIGTTNNPHPLQDATGSRRYICLRIPEGHLINNIDEVEYDQLYAQLVHEVKSGMRYWFSNDEVKDIQKMNAPFMQVKGLEQMLANCFSASKNGEGELLKTDRVISILKEQFPNADQSKMNKTAVGKALKAMDVKKVHKADGEYYQVVVN
ncbi:MAG: VapE family protein [Prevotellaceae bacterium]|nr:VapE family protein [Prevotellaceae bacterium]